MTKTSKTAETVAETVDAASKIEIPAMARDFAQRAVKTAQERAETLNASAEKAAATIGSALNGAATTLVEASGVLQGAIYADVKASLAAAEKITAAKSLAEAAQIHVEFLGERGKVGLARMSDATEYLAKAAQDAIAKLSRSGAKAA